jgi:hypothetical protein
MSGGVFRLALPAINESTKPTGKVMRAGDGHDSKA